MSKYDKLREQLGRSLSALATAEKKDVHRSLLKACEALNEIEFGTRTGREPVYNLELIKTSST